MRTDRKHMKIKINKLKNLFCPSRKSNGERITDSVQSIVRVLGACRPPLHFHLLHIRGRSRSRCRALIHNNNGIDSAQHSIYVIDDRLSIGHVIP